MNISFFKSYDDPLKVEKNLNFVASVEGKIKEGTPMKTPIAIIKRESLPGFSGVNYAYVSEFGRYYFVREFTAMSGGLIYMQLEIDALMSFSSGIRQINTMIERQEFLHSPQIQDSELPVRSERRISYLKIGSLGSNSTIVLTVTGGGA